VIRPTRTITQTQLIDHSSPTKYHTQKPGAHTSETTYSTKYIYIWTLNESTYTAIKTRST